MNKVQAFAVVKEEKRAELVKELFKGNSVQMPTSVVCHGDVMQSKSEVLRGIGKKFN